MSRLVPLRRSLLVRLLATSLLIAVCATAATAWLTTQLTKRAVTQEQSRTLSADTDIYDTLIEYAATHDGWDGAQAKVVRLAELTGTRIALTTPTGGRSPGPTPVPSTPRSRPTCPPPRSTRSSWTRGSPATPVAGSTRARSARTGCAEERRFLRRGADDYVAFLRRRRSRRRSSTPPSGRPVVRRISVAPTAPRSATASTAASTRSGRSARPSTS